MISPEDMMVMQDCIRRYALKLDAIRKEARVELARIEEHGGEAGFAKRILAIVEAP